LAPADQSIDEVADVLLLDETANMRRVAFVLRI